MSSSSPRVANQEEAAALLGVKYRTLQRWQNEAWFPETARNEDGYDIEAVRNAAIVAGRIDGPNRSSGNEKATQSQKIKLAREAEGLKLDSAKRQTAELKLAEHRGEVIPRPAFEMHFAKALTSLSDWLEQEPPILVSKIAGLPKKWRPKVVSAIVEAHRELRRQFRSDMEAAAREMDQTAHRSHPLIIECDDADDQAQALKQLTAAGYRVRKLA